MDAGQHMGSMALWNPHLLFLHDIREKSGFGIQRGDLAEQNDRVCDRCVCVQCSINCPFR